MSYLTPYFQKFDEFQIFSRNFDRQKIRKSKNLLLLNNDYSQQPLSSTPTLDSSRLCACFCLPPFCSCSVDCLSDLNFDKIIRCLLGLNSGNISILSCASVSLQYSPSVSVDVIGILARDNLKKQKETARNPQSGEVAAADDQKNESSEATLWVTDKGIRFVLYLL